MIGKRKILSLWMIIITSLITTIQAQVTVSFYDENLEVIEGQSFNVRLIKTGINIDPFLVIIEVQNDLDGDFVGVTQVARFQESGSTFAYVSFTIKEDLEPEDDEVFYLYIITLNDNVKLGRQSRLRVTVSANDDAYGIFRISNPSPVEAQEQLFTYVINLQVVREVATFGRVEVSYLVNSTSEAGILGADLSPTHGILTFEPRETEQAIQLEVAEDDIPENDESFFIQLTFASSETSAEASVITTPVEIIIKANDAPVRFVQTQYRFEEGPQTRVERVNIVRGLAGDGVSLFGPSSGQVIVHYEFRGSSAEEGVDFSYVGNDRTITFEPGVTSQSIEFEIEDDTIPELQESFEIYLEILQGDAVLVDPNIASIFINANDNPNGILSFLPGDEGDIPLKQVDEDTYTDVRYVVKRFDGTHGEVTVGWRITRDRGSSPVSDDIGPDTGTLTFLDGENEAYIDLTVVQDTLPEAAEMFTVHLLPPSVTGNARVEGISGGKLLLEDSDDVYGTVEFGPDSGHSIVSSQNPRLLRLSLTRSGGKSENLRINISVSYEDGTHAIDENDVFELPEASFVMEAQQSPVSVEFELLPATFLVVDGEFGATITGIDILRELPFGAFNSPKIGPKGAVTVIVTDVEANGETGFFNVSTIEIEEPESGVEEISLIVSREGLSGHATIRWSITGESITSDDVVSLQGTLTLASGVGETYLVVGIKADSIPEVDERIQVSLDSIEPTSSQRFRPGSTEITIIIKANDNPGGIIRFSPLMNATYTLTEGTTPLEVIVERIGGDLMQRTVQYVMEPNGANEFFGSTNILKFSPGQNESRATILPKSDKIPELRENFVLVLVPSGDPPSEIGEPTSVSVIIEENDHPYGIIHFSEDSGIMSTGEGARDAETKVTLEIRRSSGTFGTVLVPWELSPNSEEDLTPSSGTITFEEGQTGFELVLTVINDEVSESDETYAVQLSSPQGGAVAGTPMVATIVILENDNPIEFVDPNVYTNEASTVELVVRRQGRVDSEATVNYRTLDGGASSAEGDYDQILTQLLVFESGEREKIITVNILDDTIPEGNETFTVQLFDAGDDLITTGDSSAVIHILANDNAYGIFSFADTHSAQVEEGSTTFLEINRNAGNFGSVKITWEIHTSNDILAIPGEDFEETQGEMIFSPQESKQYLQVSPLADDNPEREEQFLVKLTGVEVISGIASSTLASLAPENLIKTVQVKASDDPFGQMAFSQEARELSVAEDFYPGQEAITQATFIVDRRQGNQGEVKVLWEVFTDELGGNIPKTYDFIFSGQQPPSLQDIEDKRRPGTQTPALLFSGASGQYITVPVDSQPLASELSDGFSLSTWVQIFSNSDGYILAQCEETGSTCLYGLHIACSSSLTQITLILPSNSVHNGQFLIDSLSSIQDAAWHHVFVSIGNKTINFFFDGELVGSRNKHEFTYPPGPYALFVGAKPPDTNSFTGYLQDVRLFTRAMEQRAVREIYMNAALKDITPISGILMYGEGVQKQSFTLSSEPDSEEEGKEVFDVILLSTTGGATLSSSDAHTTVAVLKSDNANGLYGFKEDCSPSRIQVEETEIECVVQRLRGDDGTVSISWTIFQRSGNNLKEAVDDFEEFQGMMTFSPGEREKTFLFKARADQVAELDEIFEVHLTSAVSDDGVIGSTNTSGASIDESRSFSQITIQENDYPYGLLQFSDQLLVTPSPDQVVEPVGKVVKVNISEEGGMANLVVLRARGTLGDIQAEWRTEDITALSQGKVPPDYVGAVGSISIASGDNFAFVNITVTDNSYPETEKTFQVELLNPTGGAQLGIGSKVEVTIIASDDAYGRFQFADNFLETVGYEVGNNGFTPVGIQVNRLGGNIGVVHVYWEASEDESDGTDIVETSGTLTFESGDSTRFLQLQIKGDIQAESDELVTVSLTGTSRGVLGDPSKTTAVVTIAANDDPYGYFVISQESRLVRIDESDQEYKVQIERKGGTFGAVDVTLRTLKPDEGTDILPSPVERADASDFVENEGRITFVENQKFAEFSITILDDDNPEVDESILVLLTGVTLVQGVPEIPESSSPKLGSEEETFAQIIIASNDDPNGRLSLSSAQLSVEESVSQIPLEVVRNGGSIGQVSISFRAIDGTARVDNDYVVQSAWVIFASGETRKQIGIAIIQDIVPELDETFSIELIPSSLSEGAALGDILKTNITILPSDDPNGVFSFGVEEINTEEKDQPHYVIIDVVRTGGSVGPVEVKWEAKLDDILASNDIRPASGSLFFVTNDQRRKLNITILPDDLPEGIEFEENYGCWSQCHSCLNSCGNLYVKGVSCQKAFLGHMNQETFHFKVVALCQGKVQDIQIQLISASDGGRIGEKSRCTMNIAPNDSPHGVIEFSSTHFTIEENTPSNQNVQIMRRGGNYGELQVHFSTSEMNIVELASHQTVDTVDLFQSPVEGKPVGEGNFINTSLDDSLTACASACAMETTCASFVYTTASNGIVCQWYISTVATNELDDDNNSDYYRKDPDKISSLNMHKARQGEDFSLISDGFVFLEDGQSEGLIRVPVVADDIPELGETFWVQLKSVEVVNEEEKTNDEPVLGQVQKASVTINVNDNAFGVFSIFSSQAGQGTTRVEVEEADRRAVDFTVKREGGSIGSVTVSWSVSAGGRTATYNEDFIADGATLTFDIGQTERVISVTLLEDDIPETDEEFTVVLHDPTGGATISNNNYSTVTILANDFVAGVLSFETATVLLNEGDQMQMKVQRTLPALGTVTATWKIQGRNGLNPTASFKTLSGSFNFLPEETEKVIELEVLSDENPEVREEYSLILENIDTQGIGPTGAAISDPQLGSVLITIASSDDPHGIFQFARSSLQLSVKEYIGEATLVVERKFGDIGVVRVSYEVIESSLRPMLSQRSPANAGSDYVQDTAGFIQMEMGQTTGNIDIQIIDDSVPEIDEVFVVRLTGVTLIDSTNPELPPKLADNETETEIIIEANDGAQGVIYFAPDSVRFSVSEQGQDISLTVVRANGTFGTVSVFSHSRLVSGSVSNKTDFEFDDGNLVFNEGESRKTIIITIVDDDKPEPAETFEIILSNPTNGARLGEANRASVTILDNDISGGFIAFDSDEVITLREPENSDDSNAQVEVPVTRGPGIYGEINIPFTIKTSSGEISKDITPNSGTLTFSDRQSEIVLVLTAINDNEPEIKESFTLLLENPSGNAQLGSQISRTIEVSPSDAPYGLLQIFTSTNRLSKYTVEESNQVLTFDITRNQGTIGAISVDFLTQADTAEVTIDTSRVVLAQLDKSAASSTRTWHQINTGEEVYMMVLTSLPSDAKLSSLSEIPPGNDGQSVLYKWQGQLSFLKTFQTNGATSATSFEINGSTYVFVTNGGREGDREVPSTLYSISQQGEMEEVQSLSTSGATDVEYFTFNSNSFVVVTNSLDDNSNSDIDSYMFIWDSSNNKFTSTPVAVINTLFAKAVTSFTIDGQLYIVIANYYDINTDSYEISSVVYKLEANNSLVQHQHLTTQGAVSIAYVEINGMHQLVIANNRQNVVRTPQDSVVYQWRDQTRAFELLQTIQTSRVESVRYMKSSSDSTFLIFANGVGNSQIFVWNSQTSEYQAAWNGEPFLSLQPIIIHQLSERLDLLGSAALDRQTEPTLFQISQLASNSDFVPRRVTMTFEPGQTTLQCPVVILTDELPEDTERFFVTLAFPTGGAELGTTSSVEVEILTNDNAHGVIEISEDDLFLEAEEKENEDNTVLISVVRKRGYFGRVVVAWQATGDQSGVGDISPLSGEVEFADGQSQATVTLYVRDDQEPEFAEVTYVTLTNIVEAGTQVDSQGAILGSNNVAKITVLANDSPYGVVAWEKSLVTMPEPTDSDETLELVIVRRQGLEKAITVTYVTSTSEKFPPEEKASPGEDFVSSQNSVSMKEGESSAKVSITIKRDDIPERDETFQVNLTSVSLVNDDNSGDAQPSIRVGGSVVLVKIAENDNARGIIEFDVATNVEGRVDVYEEFGKNVTLHLPVKRSVGFFGSLTVTWQATLIEASLRDFIPSSGTVAFEDQQEESKISITIIDDALPEQMETFDVKLLDNEGVPELGASTSVKVAILKNDSPAGLFKFAALKVETRESQSSSDPDGQAVVVVQRVQGTQGGVRVQWRLNAGSENDFTEPLEGTVVFRDGESEKSIILQTQPDDVLEGREEFVISLVDATNDADISPTEGDCTIVILPNQGSSGIVTIQPESREVIVAEPGEMSPLYTGKEEIILTRGIGRFGIVEVSWSITPRDIGAFMQVEGNVTFDDLHSTAIITIQSRDDSTPELRRTFTLQLNSATGGATISTKAQTATIIYAASDYPHGLVQFSLPEVRYVSEEEQSSILLEVERDKGVSGSIRVAYTTVPDEAEENEDYLPSVSSLRFLSGETQKTIEVVLRNDDLPEGPEKFYVNLTFVEVIDDQNDYTEYNGLTRDMRPGLGTLSMKTIIIEKSDDPEGSIQFVDTNLSVKEEDGRAVIPLERINGNYGEVSVTYTTEEGTASEDIDYIPASGDLIFANKQNNATIIVQIQDDTFMESAETFIVFLTSASGGARLGSRTTLTVTIEKSEFPNGRFSFREPLTLTIPNPIEKDTQVLVVQRTGGVLGQQQVFWQIMGPNNPDLLLEDTSDIGYVSGEQEVTSSSLAWEDGESGEKLLALDIKPYTTWEVEKVFIVKLYRVTSTSASRGEGEIDVQNGEVQITVLRFGEPNGVIGFVANPNEIIIIEPEGNSPTTVRFEIERRPDTGATGNIVVYWEVRGEGLTTSDIHQLNGEVVMAENVRDAEISLQILPDDEPELTEHMSLILTKVEGGAEIDSNFNQSFFNIRYNDFPHGEFAILPELQSIEVDPADLARSVKLNFTRFYGTFGSVLLEFSVVYDVDSLITLERSSGTVLFGEGVKETTTSITIIGNHFLAVGKTFTVSITNLVFIGSGQTDPPTERDGFSEARIFVPSIAGNSELSFSDDFGMINEEEQTLTVTLKRIGTYGDLSVDWVSGYAAENLTTGLTNGDINPSSGTVNMIHGQEIASITVQVSPSLNRQEVFALRLYRQPQSTVNGRARLASSNLLVHAEQYGLIGFSDDSLFPEASELNGKITLTTWRLYGSVGRVHVYYNSMEDTAEKDQDFDQVQNGVITFEDGQMSATFDIKINQDNIPEPSEQFSVVLTKVERFPTPLTQVASPRISEVRSTSQVTIRESNDPYGIFHLIPVEKSVNENHASIDLTVVRSAGLFGSVSVTVRTVGGGEPWTSQIDPRTDSQTEDTIADVLGKRDSVTSAEFGEDYRVLDVEVHFASGEITKPVTVTILDDTISEPDETILLYLTLPAGGARIAEGTPDGGLKGYAIVTILASDTSNGIIGFVDRSRAVSVDESRNSTFTLDLIRLNAYFGDVKVRWRAKKSLTSSDEEDSEVTDQLVAVSGETTCLAEQSACELQVQLMDDQIPEQSFTFYVILTSVGEGGQISTQSNFSVVTIEPSDDVEGLIQFTEASRFKVVRENEQRVELAVQKLNGNDNEITAAYRTIMLSDNREEFGVTIYPALESGDFESQTGRLQFPANSQEMQYIVITLTPQSASTNPLPKQFEVLIYSASGKARINQFASVARIQIVKDGGLGMWQLMSQQPLDPYSDHSALQSLLIELDKMAQGDLSDENLDIIENVLGNVNDEGTRTQYPQSVNVIVHNLYCKLLTDRTDARIGRHSLAEKLENFAYTLVTGSPCQGNELQESSQCSNIRISAGRWVPDNLSGHKFEAHQNNTFTLPQNLPTRDTSLDDENDGCLDFSLLEYSSDVWFRTKNAGGRPAGQKIVSFSFKGRKNSETLRSSPVMFKIDMPDRRVAPADSSCVYFDIGEEKWQDDVCEATNDLSKGIYRYLDCECNHMSSYAVIEGASAPAAVTEDDDDDIADYVVWFYIIVFICMFCLVSAVITHHLCFPLATFSASLNMHFFMAVVFTQLCFVIDAFLSPDDILEREPARTPNDTCLVMGQPPASNDECLVMGLFLHYFFLAQFSWISVQSVNLWKVLIWNDEHSGRHFCLFFILGWGVPAVLLAIFHATTYNIYKYHTDLCEDFIYGNVSDLDHICFITNGYAALGGILAPVMIALFIVVAVFVNAYQVSSQWLSYDDIYRGFYNSREVPLLLLIWALLVISYIWLALHMIYGYQWLLIMFCIFDIIMSMLVFVLYAILHNPKLSHLFGTPKSTYVVSDEVAGFSLPEPFYDTHSSMASMKGSQASLVNNAWEKNTNGGFSQMTVRRALPSQVYINPPIAVVSPANTIDSNIPDFDDLIYALKVGRSLTPSELSRSLDDDLSQLSVPLDHYETKRINIADTHL